MYLLGHLITRTLDTCLVKAPSADAAPTCAGRPGLVADEIFQVQEGA
ncbi:MAG TPA: hypothetical protein VFQ44_20340 [Streptosporangiaceae bacterium]|nr:hypothetical protein [Streptosporangiaceae bacterium]